MKPTIHLKFYGYLKKDILLLVKRKKYLYLSILLPLIIAGIFLFMLNPSNAFIKIGVCDFDNTYYSKEAFKDLEGFKAVILPNDDCINQLKEQIKSGKLSLGIEIEKGFSKKIESLKQAKLIIYYDNTDISLSNLISWKVDVSLLPYERAIIDALNQELKKKVSAIRFNVDLALELTPSYRRINEKIKQIDKDLKRVEELETEFLVNPLYAEKVPIYEHTFAKASGIAFIFPILALFITLMLSSTSLIYDRKTNFITRVKASTSPITYLLAKLVFFTLLTIVQFLIILLLFLAYGSAYHFPFFNVLHMIIFIAVINTLLGMLIGCISENEGIALLFSLIISFPLMLLSGIFFPLQTMPAFVQYLAKLLPLHYQIIAVKSVLLFNLEISSKWIITAIILFMLVYYLIRKK